MFTKIKLFVGSKKSVFTTNDKGNLIYKKVTRSIIVKRVIMDTIDFVIILDDV